MMDRAESEAPSMAMVPTPEAENVKEAEIAAAPARGQQSPPVINSMTHPDAWAWLNRSCKPGKNLVPDEVLSDWMAGGQKRNALLHSFVKKVYQPNASQLRPSKVDGQSTGMSCARAGLSVLLRATFKTLFGNSLCRNTTPTC